MKDILQPLPFEQWPLLRDSLKRDWPSFAYEYNSVNNSIKWKTQDPLLNIQIYCPYGKYDFGLFLCIGLFQHSLYIALLFAFEESKHLISRVLEETKVINWNIDVYFKCLNENIAMIIQDTLIELKKSKNFEIEYIQACDCYFKSKEDCAELNIEVPEECELKHLDESNIPLIHSVWPRKDFFKNPEKTTEYHILTLVVRLNRGLGFFLKRDNSLVSWVLHTEYGGLGVLQTVDGYKGRGYGKKIVNAMIKELAVEENLDSVLFVHQTNESSIKLFKSLGYSRISAPTDIFIKSGR